MKILIVSILLLLSLACDGPKPGSDLDNPTVRFDKMPKPAKVISVTKNTYYETCTMVALDASNKYNFFPAQYYWCGFHEGQIIQ